MNTTTLKAGHSEAKDATHWTSSSVHHFCCCAWGCGVMSHWLVTTAIGDRQSWGRMTDKYITKQRKWAFLYDKGENRFSSQPPERRQINNSGPKVWLTELKKNVVLVHQFEFKYHLNLTFYDRKLRIFYLSRRMIFIDIQPKV